MGKQKKPVVAADKKIVVLTFSKDYVIHHPKRGQYTAFKEKFLAGTKIHTIRPNIVEWMERAEKINSSEFVLHIREWEGIPYHSTNLPSITTRNKITIQGICIRYTWNEAAQKSETVILVETADRLGYRELTFEEVKELAANDGLDGSLDLVLWFKDIRGKKLYKPMVFNGAIIHFTDKWY